VEEKRKRRRHYSLPSTPTMRALPYFGKEDHLTILRYRRAGKRGKEGLAVVDGDGAPLIGEKKNGERRRGRGKERSTVSSYRQGK